MKKQQSLRLTELQIEDFKRIVFVKMSVRPGITEICAPNGAGKSSALDAIQIWLDGLKVKDAPTEPIRNGAKRSRVRGRLGDMYVIRTITPRKGGGHETEIRFEPAEGPSKGKAYPATQKMLNDLIGEHNLDPLDFVRLDMKGKFDALKVFVPNFDFEQVAQSQAADRARRRDVNKLAEEARAAANMITVPDGVPTEPIDEQALIRELQQAGERNAERERRQAARERALETVRVGRAAIAQVDAAIATATEAAQAARDQEVARIQEQIDMLRRQIERTQTACSERIARETERLRQEARAASARADELQAKLDAAEPLPDVIDTGAISEQIEAARKTNQAVMRAKERARYAATAEQYEKESATLTAQMETREAAKQRAIAEAQLPIPGIEFGDGEIRYRGAPLEQASTAQKLRVAVARMVALNPKLRLGWIRDASLLDDDSYAELNRLANEHEIDILIETVRPIGKDVVVLCEGRLKSEADEQPQAALV
jgi:energy-coupling factor transporter ATP-binding protein EcfA2